jgi:hypothetical protein
VRSVPAGDDQPRIVPSQPGESVSVTVETDDDHPRSG